MNIKALTLTELLIIILIGIISLMGVFKGYNFILKSYVRHTNIIESTLEVNIFKEILRKDIEGACFCLTNNEINNAFNFGSSQFKIKSTLGGLISTTNKKFGYINEDCSISLINNPIEGSFNNENCRVISYPDRNSYINCICDNYIHCPSSTNIDIDTSINDCYYENSLLVCGYNGILEISYYLQKPSDPKKFPKKCNNLTKILYRKIGSTSMPLLECTLYLKMGAIMRDNTWQTGTLSGEDIKEVIAFVIYQKGKKERFEIFPNNKIRVNFPDNSYEDVNIPDKHYRWELIEIHARPINCWNKNI